MVSFAVTRNGMTWGEGQQGSYIEIPYGRSPNCTSDSNACYVISDGVVYYDVSNNAYCVEPDGYAVSSSNWDFTYSYGDKIKIGILNEYT